MREINVQLIEAALADPARYRALDLICGCETITSQALCEKLGLTAATISHHLRQLRLALLIESIKDGRWRLHKVRRETLDAYVEALSALGSLERPGEG
ncbi:MAG: putative ArsR family transcriptional regulator [Acidobacteriaceae bacterium]|nr:putative ArsR family transcriptional regulator [Acidobacteriaceae bacterium]